MANIFELESNIKEIIDELKGLLHTNGLSGSAKEELIITSIFLYKFLNDKFVANLGKFADELNMTTEEILSDTDLMDAFYDKYSEEVSFKSEDTIETLINYAGKKDFYKVFDDTLTRISQYPNNEKFGIKTEEGKHEPLFTPICENIEMSKRNGFAQGVFNIIASKKFDFTSAFTDSFDFYSRVFEYLIKDYNVAQGTYAEYFTPQAVSAIIAKILVEMSPVEDRLYEVYDPSAGSGSLVLHLAHALGKGSFGNKAIVYTQDISEKSTRFLRLNLLLNGLTNCLLNVVHGDTLLNPSHYNNPNDINSGLKKFDYITSNPPFKLDFSSTRDDIATKWQDTDRFFAGIPSVPKKKKDSMAIYLCFIQHILWSLKQDGKAAIVVPTGFLTAQGNIEETLRKKIVNNHWLKGVISMPSKIFANTTTNVSVLFIDKSNQDGTVILEDASKLGEKKKEGKNTRTVLRPDEILKIEDTFISQKVIEDFSVKVTFEQIKEKGYSFSAGQYFPIKIDYVQLSSQDYDKQMKNFYLTLSNSFRENDKLEKIILDKLGELKYEG